MKNNIKKLEERLENMDFAVNENHKEQLGNQLKYKIKTGGIKTQIFIKSKKYLNKRFITAVCTAVVLFALLVGTAAANDVFSKIIKIFTFDASINYVLVSEEDYINPFSVEPDYISEEYHYGLKTDEEKIEYINKINEDLKGQLFDENFNPIYPYYVDMYEYMAKTAYIKKPENTSPAYIITRVRPIYNSAGEQVADIGIREGDDKYTPFTYEETFSSQKTVAFNEEELKKAEEFIGVKIKLPEGFDDKYKIDDITFVSRIQKKPYMEKVLLRFSDKKSGEWVCTLFCEKTENNEAENIYIIREPNIFTVGKYKIYEFFDPVTIGSEYKWKDKNVVYSLISDLSEKECFGLIKSMK